MAMKLDFFKKYCNKRNILFLVIFATLSLFFSESAFADPVPQLVQPTDASNLITSLHAAMQIIGALLGIVTSLVTLLINPGWYNGEIFNLQTYFKAIWILVSNVVYFIFAFILIWIAFMNIIGKGTENYELKKALPKFAI